MRTKQTMTLRQICDATEMRRLQETKPFTMTNVTIDGSALRVEFSDRVESHSKKKLGLLYETSEVRFECAGEAMAERWNAALNGGAKLSLNEIASPARPIIALKNMKAPASARIEADERTPLLLEAKAIFNTQTGQKDTIRLRFSADSDGNIPYKLVPCESAKTAQGELQKFKETVQQNTALIARL